MKYTPKMPAASFVLVFMLFTLGWVSTARCELATIDEQALTYVENVLPIGFAHYQITNNSYELPEMPNATYRSDAVTFILNSSDSLLFVNCMFRDGVQYTCDMRVQRGLPEYVRDCSNLLEVARAIIEGHQSQTGVDCSYLLETLDMVTTTENVTTVTSGNVKLTVSSGHLPIPMGLQMVNGTLHLDHYETRNVTSFHWASAVGDEEQIIFSLGFDNGNLYSLRDERIINNFSINLVGNSPEDKSSLEGTESGRSESTNSHLPGEGIVGDEIKDQAETGTSQLTFSPPAMFAVVLASGIVASVCLVFYFTKRGALKETVKKEHQTA